MKKFEILEHKADLKIRAFGKTKEELFCNALLGMIESMRSEKEKPPKTTKREIKIKSSDLPALLVDFLSEVLYLTQVNKEIYNSVKFKKFSDPLAKSSAEAHPKSSGQVEVEAELTGQKVERFGEDIKAVTYHSLDVHQEEDGTWQATVLFDI